MLTQVGVKQLTNFLRTVTAASDLVDCTLVKCAVKTRLRNMPDCRIELRACFLCIKVCLGGMFMLKVDIKLTIYFCSISTTCSIENDLNELDCFLY